MSTHTNVIRGLDPRIPCASAIALVARQHHDACVVMLLRFFEERWVVTASGPVRSSPATTLGVFGQREFHTQQVGHAGG